jgi:hypothetical protein
MKKNMLVGMIALAVFGLLLTVITVYAATFITVVEGPDWQGSGNGYEATICTNTAFGETVYTQTTTDGSALTGDINTNPTAHASWNGTVVACNFGQFEPGGNCGGSGSGEGTWICSFDDTPDAIINYRYLVANQSNDWYGLETGGTIETGPTAVTLQSLTAVTAIPTPFLFIALLLVAAVALLTAVALRRRIA